MIRISTALLLASIAGSVYASEPATTTTTRPVEAPQVIEMAVSPAALPEPSLKFELLPVAWEQTRGDAAPIYLTTFLRIRMDQERNQVTNRISAMLEMPMEQFPVEEAQRIVDAHQSILESLELASRRDRCNWEIPFREEGFETLLPQLQDCREATWFIALAAHLHTRQGHTDQAIRTLQSGFALVHHLKNDACLVQGLVAIGCADILLKEVQALEKTGNGPNLYWALTDLPRPLVDLGAMIETERSWLLFDVPPVDTRRARDWSAEQFRAIFKRMDPVFKYSTDTITRHLTYAGMIALSAPPARQWLLSHGCTTEQIQDVPIERATQIYLFESYMQEADDIYKWYGLPYWQARPGLRKATEKFVAFKASHYNPLLSVIPAMGRMYTSAAHAERAISVLQIIEALRAYAAGHGNQLPKALSDITETPVPIDPMTGLAFDYEMRGSIAILKSTGGPQAEPRDQVEYRITLRAN